MDEAMARLNRPVLRMDSKVRNDSEFQNLEGRNFPWMEFFIHILPRLDVS